MRMMMRCSGYQLADALAVILAELLADVCKYDRRYVNTITGGSRADIYMALNAIISGLLRDSKIGNPGLEYRIRNGPRRLEMEAKGKEVETPPIQASDIGNDASHVQSHSDLNGSGLRMMIQGECSLVGTAFLSTGRGGLMGRGKAGRSRGKRAITFTLTGLAGIIAASTFSPARANAATGDLVENYIWRSGAVGDYGISIDPETKQVHTTDTAGQIYESDSLDSSSYYFMRVPVSGEYNFADMAENSTYFWVTGNSKDKIWRINKSTKEIVDEWNSPVNDFMGLEWYNNYLWATKPNPYPGFTNLYKYNDETHNLEATINLPGVTMSSGLAINQSTGTFYVCRNDNAGFWSFNIQSDAKDIQWHSFSEAWDSARGATCLDSDYLLVLYMKPLQGSKIYKYQGLDPVATPTPSPTATPQPTATPTPTRTPTPSPTASPSPKPTATPTSSPTPYVPSPTPTCGPSVPPNCFVIAAGDYDGDRKVDTGIFRLSQGFWSIKDVTRTFFGGSGDIPASGDYDGDGTAEMAVFRPGQGLWSVKDLTRVYLGGTGDLSAPGDYDGDGSCDIAIFRDNGGMWSIRNLSRFYFGGTGDWPLPGDWDGNGTDETALYRPASGQWMVRNISRFYLGSSSDWPIPGDYAGGGAVSAGIFRACSGMWALRDITRVFFGNCFDHPVPADYSGEGTTDIGIFRDSAGLWSVRNITRVYFGGTGDIPVTR